MLAVSSWSRSSRVEASEGATAGGGRYSGEDWYACVEDSSNDPVGDEYWKAGIDSSSESTIVVGGCSVSKICVVDAICFAAEP